LTCYLGPNSSPAPSFRKLPMRTLIFLTTVCLVAFCTISLAAQNSATFSSADKYRAAKIVLQQFYDQGDLSSQVGKDGLIPDEYDLTGTTCLMADDFIGSYRDDSGDKAIDKPQHRNDDIADFVKDAVDIVTWENDFRKLKIPESVWRPFIDADESTIIDLNAKEFILTKQMSALNKRMKKAGLSKPIFVYQPGCGSGGEDVHFALQPKDGQLFLIPVFLYKLCQIQHLNPLDFQSCDRWKEILDEQVWDVSGDYMYIARWSDGVVRCGKFSYGDFRSVAEKPNELFTITKLRSPGCSPAF
jgi:hypothetical protein